MIHLAFKGMTTEEIDDTLTFCFVKAARRYDPHNAVKTKKVCEEISGLSKGIFTVAEIELRVGFSCTGILRMLVRKGFLASITGKKKVVGYQLGAAWPAPAAFFESGPMGFVYILQLWFRYYLNEYVTGRMSEIESNDGVLQLGDTSSGEHYISGQNAPGFESIQRNSEGNCTNSTGKFRFMADRTLMDAPLDISAMNLDWVAENTDKMFRHLTPSQRMVLYLYFHEEQSFKVIGKAH